MSESEERLAPVTYLFGARRSAGSSETETSENEPSETETPGTEPSGAETDARDPGADDEFTDATPARPASPRSGSTGAAPATRRLSPTHPAGSRLPTLRSVYGGRFDPADGSADHRADDADGHRADGGPTHGPVHPHPSASFDGESDDDSDDDGDAERMTTERIENISLHALGRKGLSRRELERTLRSRGVDDEAVEAEVSRLEGVGLIDDVALAQNLVGLLQERKGLGRTGVAAELAKRMLSPMAIEYALELVDSGDELARARELAVARARQLTRLDPETARRRLSAYLARRGYGGSTVRAAVDAALQSPKAGATVRFR